MTNAIPLSPREARRRDYILNGNLWGVVLTVTAPLAVYSVFNYLYGFFDMILAGRIGSDAVASILIFDDIKATIAAVGVGIAAAGTVFVARHYGAGEYEEARRHAGAMLLLATVASAVFALVMILGWRPLLAALSTPAEVVAGGLGYYRIQMASTVLLAFNAVYMGVERAKGNTTMILVLNVVAMAVKMALSLLFVLGFRGGMTEVALATLIAQGMLAILAAIALFRHGNALAIRRSDLVFSRAYTLPIARVALPVIGGKVLFSLGRVIVNTIATAYGTQALAAFSIAMKTSSIGGAIASVFEDPTTAITSQNLGARKLKRALDANVVANILAVSIGTAAMLAVTFAFDAIAPVFTDGDRTALPLIRSIFMYERFSIASSAVIGIVSGFFLGFKITKATFVLNAIRLFVLRIPTLLVCLAIGVGPIATGYAMFISNNGTALVALLAAVVFYRKVKAYGYLDMRVDDVV